MSEKITTGIIFLFSIFFFAMSFSISAPYVECFFGGSSWPKLLLLLLMASSGIQLAKILARGKDVEATIAKASRKKQLQQEEQTGERVIGRLLIFGMIYSGIAIYLMKWIGFSLSALIFMALYMWILGYRKKMALVIVPVGVVAVFLGLFVKATYIPLPRGVGFFKSISLLFY